MTRFAACAALFALLAAACGKSDCEKKLEVEKKAADDACKERSTACWWCDCYNQNLRGPFAYDPSDPAKIVGCTPGPAFNPVNPETVTCEGDELEAAQACTRDESACRKVVVDDQSAKCDASRK